MPWARASTLDRHLECPGSSHLPRLEHGAWRPGYLAPPDSVFVAPAVAVEERDSSAADWGTEMHRAKAGDPAAAEPWLTWVEPHRATLWPDRLGEHEVGVAYSCRTGAVAVKRGTPAEIDAWKAALDSDWITGTCDWFAELPTSEPWIDDLKTGWQTPPTVTAQTLFYALVRWKEANSGALENAAWTSARISVTHWPRAKEPTEPRRAWAQLSDTALIAFEGDLKRAWTKAVGFNPAPRPGDHCLYCPSASVCDRANG